MTETFTLYGATTCDDTERTRAWLSARGVEFVEVNIDDDADADALVRVLNQGFRSTPTLVFGTGRRKVILTEPTETELRTMLVEQGVLPARRRRACAARFGSACRVNSLRQ